MKGCLPSQTVGPFFSFALTANADLGCMANPQTKGEHIRLRCTLLDGDGQPVPDGMIELWQADANGRYRHPGDVQPSDPDPLFHSFGRLATDAEGRCTFHTIRPGAVPDGRGHTQAAHINVSVFARGLLNRLCTRVYFEGDPGLAADPVLALAPADRRATLLARRDTDTNLWDFEIHLQGERETVFFDV